MLDFDPEMAKLADQMDRRLRAVSQKKDATIRVPPKLGFLLSSIPNELIERRLRTFEDVAAVSGRFDPMDEFTQADDASLRQALLNRALSHFVVETFDGKLLWLLLPGVRAERLRRLSESGELKALLKRQLPVTDDYGNLLRELLNKQTKLPLKKRTPTALRHLRTIVEDLKDTSLPTPDAGEIDRLLNVGAFEREFLTIDKPFVGRTAELALLHEFLSRPPDSTKSWPRWTAMIVSGLGGSGKSALLARFLRDVHRNKSATLVIFDFDRPGIDASDTVWLRTEMARQIGLQCPDIAVKLRKARRETREVQAQAARQQSSRMEKSGHDRSSDDLLYQIRDALASVGADGRPMLMVLDTLEVLATSDAQHSLLGWIDTVSDIFHSTPLKVLFSGRLFDSALAAFRARASQEPLELDALPVSAAEALLRKSGVSAGLASALVRSNWLPRRPLELRLLARLATDNQVSADSLERDLRQGNKVLSAGVIYRRVLARISDGVVGQLASPGLVLRYVTPELIREVLGPALNLPPMTEDEAKSALNRLAAYSWLVTRAGDIVHHRRDLRRSMLRLMIQDNPAQAKNISDKAVEFFRSESPPNASEANYHQLLWLLQPDEGSELSLAGLKDAYPSIAPDIEDLPAPGAALLRFASLKGVPASDVELLPSNHFLSAYDKTGQRQVRSREFGQALRLLERKETIAARNPEDRLSKRGFEWERDVLFATANWDRLSTSRRREVTDPDGLIPDASCNYLAKIFFHDAVMGRNGTDYLRNEARALLNRFAEASAKSARSESYAAGLAPLATGLLLSGGMTKEAWPLLSDILERYRQSREKPSAILDHRLELLTTATETRSQPVFHLAPSLLPLRREMIVRLSGLEALAGVRALFADLLSTLESHLAKKSLTTRNVLSAVDVLYKHDDLWRTVSLHIGSDIDPMLLRGPDIEFRDPVRFCLLAEFTDDAGRKELAGIVQKQIDMPLADLAPAAFAEALALDAEHALETPVELVDRSWRLGALLDAVAAVRPGSSRVQWVREAYQRWNDVVEGALTRTQKHPVPESTEPRDAPVFTEMPKVSDTAESKSPRQSTGNSGGSQKTVVLVAGDPRWRSFSVIALTILEGYGEVRPVSLERLVCKYEDESRLSRAVAGGVEDAEVEFVAATVFGGSDTIRLSSARFGPHKDAFLSGFGPGEASVREGRVHFADGIVTVSAIDFPRDGGWGLYCLSSEQNPAESENLEVFALRCTSPPDSFSDPYDFVEAGYLIAAKQRAEANAWSDARMDGLRIVTAVRMELLIEEAVADIKASSWFSSDYQYLVEKLEQSGKRVVASIVQAIGSRLRSRTNIAPGDARPD